MKAIQVLRTPPSPCRTNPQLLSPRPPLTPHCLLPYVSERPAKYLHRKLLTLLALRTVFSLIKFTLICQNRTVIYILQSVVNSTRTVMVRIQKVVVPMRSDSSGI
jgi:hypothetical protein